MNILLLQPPVWIPTQPYLSIPSLIGYLKQQNIECKQKDLNIYFFNLLFEVDTIRKFIFSDENEQKFNKKVGKKEYGVIKDFILDNVEYALDIIKSEKGLNYVNYVNSVSLLSMILDYYNFCNDYEEIKFDNYITKYSPDSISDIKNFIKDFEEEKINLPIMEYAIKKFICENDIAKNDVIGISVTGRSQVIPTILLTMILKRNNPKITIIWGGNLVSRWLKYLDRIKFLFKYVDYITINEGELNLSDLLAYISDKQNNTIPSNVIYYEGDILHIDKVENKYNINCLPTPIFNKEELNEYFSPIIILPLLASRGCYWRKCTFCDHSHIYGNYYSFRNKKNLLKDIETLYYEYGCRYINFHDEAMTPTQLKSVSDTMNYLNKNIIWTTDLRFDKKLNFETLKYAKENGLSVIFFGLESINNRILKLMKKGISKDSIINILEVCKRLNIWTHLFYIQNFPTETLEEYKETIKFLEMEEDLFMSSGRATFGLNIYSPIAKCPDEYGLELIENEDSLSMSIDYISDKESIDEKNEISKEQYGCYSKFTLYVFRDHWGIFNSTFNNFIKSYDIFLLPWINIYEKRECLIDAKNNRIFYLTNDLLKLIKFMNSTNLQDLKYLVNNDEMIKAIYLWAKNEKLTYFELEGDNDES